MQWVIPGKIFKSYFATNAEAQVTLVPAADLQNATFYCYWQDWGDNRQVSVSFKVDGIPCNKSVTFNVKRPVITWGSGDNPPPIGYAQLQQLGNGSWLIRLLKTGLASPGIAFRAQLLVPAPFAEGKWYFVQMIKQVLKHKLEDGSCVGQTTSGTWMLDLSVPYDPANPPFYWETGTGYQYTSDSPQSGTTGSIQVVRHDEFEMYIMFKPAGVGLEAEWVPFKVARWSWNFCCTRRNGEWFVDERGQSSHEWVDPLKHPEWTANAADLPLGPLPCPPPCSSSSSSSSN